MLLFITWSEVRWSCHCSFWNSNPGPSEMGQKVPKTSQHSMMTRTREIHWNDEGKKKTATVSFLLWQQQNATVTPSRAADDEVHWGQDGQMDRGRGLGVCLGECVWERVCVCLTLPFSTFYLTTAASLFWSRESWWTPHCFRPKFIEKNVILAHSKKRSCCLLLPPVVRFCHWRLWIKEFKTLK